MRYEAIARAQASPDEPRRNSGSGRFPYNDLENAEAVLRVMLANNLTTTDPETLDDELRRRDLGTGRARIAACVWYGYVETGYQTVTLTDLGQAALAPETKVTARQRAFMRVPLFATVAEQYEGKPVPLHRDDHRANRELERALVAAGTLQRSAVRARWVFLRNLKQAEMLRDNDVVIPKHVYQVKTPRPVTQLPVAGVPVGGTPNTPGLDPLIQGLISRIPTEPPWPADKREEWLQAARLNFELVYGDGS